VANNASATTRSSPDPLGSPEVMLIQILDLLNTARTWAPAMIFHLDNRNRETKDDTLHARDEQKANISLRGASITPLSGLFGSPRGPGSGVRLFEHSMFSAWLEPILHVDRLDATSA
jgi:hypothetical protein